MKGVTYGWLIVVVPNLQLFKKFNRSYTAKVKIRNDELIQVEGKGHASIYTRKGIKFIPDVLYVLP